MNKLLIALLLLGLLTTAAHAKSRDEEAACAAVKEEIREIEARMRAGYTRAQGERYEAKLRKLKARLACHLRHGSQRPLVNGPTRQRRPRPVKRLLDALRLVPHDYGRRGWF